MTLGGKKLATKYLDPDLCYAAWVMAGSCSRARTRLANDGIIHPVTGQPPSKMGITYAAKESGYYRDYLSRRVEHPEMAEVPNKAEFEQAKTLYAQILPEQAEIVKRLREQLGTIEYA